MKTLGEFAGIYEANDGKRVLMDPCGCCAWSKALNDFSNDELKELHEELRKHLGTVEGVLLDRSTK